MFPENRIPTTHVGSVIRPPELLRYITAQGSRPSPDLTFCFRDTRLSRYPGSDPGFAIEEPSR
jgi:hypothetical protein